jgi:hypothetical protein
MALDQAGIDVERRIKREGRKAIRSAHTPRNSGVAGAGVRWRESEGWM